MDLLPRKATVRRRTGWSWLAKPRLNGLKLYYQNLDYKGLDYLGHIYKECGLDHVFLKPCLNFVYAIGSKNPREKERDAGGGVERKGKRREEGRVEWNATLTFSIAFCFFLLDRLQSASIPIH